MTTESMSEHVELDILEQVGYIANLPLGLDNRLNQIIQVTVEMLRADIGMIYFREGSTYWRRALYGIDPDHLLRSWTCPHTDSDTLPSETPPCQCHDGCLALFDLIAPQLSPEHLLSAVLSTPILDEQQGCVGIIGLGNWQDRTFTDAETIMMTALASQVFGMIRNAHLHTQLQQKLQEQTRIYDVSKALSSTLDLDELLSLIAKTSVELIHARGCVLRLLDREQTGLEMKASYGDVTMKEGPSVRKIGEGIAGLVAERETPIRIDHVTPELLESEVITSMQYSLICIPIIGKEGVIGTIASFDKNPESTDHRFTAEDVNLLSAFAGQAAITIEHARFYERMEELALDNLLRLRELSILYHINTAMRSTVRLNKLLRIILTGVTIGGGLGFNRAVLLMVNERAQSLKGMLAVGPSSGEEANQIWQKNVKQQKTLVEMIVNVPEDEETIETSFEQTAKSIWMPLSLEHGIFARTVLEQHAFNVDEQSEYIHESQHIIDMLGTPRFATVPLIVRDKVIGMIYVDNKYNNVPISEDDMNFLQMFANQAALAIDNAILYSNVERRNQELRSVQDQLLQSEKMMALGEMSATIAHEIRNPLICVGGFARRLLKDESLSDKSRKYVNVISEETTRLENILQDILTFSRDTRMQFTSCNLNTIIKSVLDILALEITDREIEVNACFYTELTPIQADAQQLKQVFLNLITNALHQVPETRGLITIMTNNALSAKGGVTVEITDNGGGIPTEIIENIFNPFFTTKGTGTGLGLAITKKIIDNHKGNINVRNRPGVGVTFVINLPLDPATAQEENIV